MTRLPLLLALGVAAGAITLPAHAADPIVEDVGIVDIASGWDGVYVGAYAGYGWGTALDDDSSLSLTDDQLDLGGGLLGVNVGANFTLTDGIVVGVVGDVAWSGISGEQAGDLLFDVNWLGSARGRVGVDGGRFLPYVTAGAAFAGATASDGVSDTATYMGWTVGGGVEFAVTDDLSVDVTYRYSDYGPADYTLSSPEEIDLVTQSLQMGVNWRF